jgi:hypothetical protein
MSKPVATKYPAPPPATKTPAPVAKAPVSRDFGYGRQSYGANQYAGASSVMPGQKASSELADNLKASGTTGELDRVIENGVRGDHRLPHPTDECTGNGAAVLDEHNAMHKPCDDYYTKPASGGMARKG